MHASLMCFFFCTVQSQSSLEMEFLVYCKYTEQVLTSDYMNKNISLIFHCFLLYINPLLHTCILYIESTLTQFYQRRYILIHLNLSRFKFDQFFKKKGGG